MDVRGGLQSKLNAKELMLLNCGVGEDSWESLGLQGYLNLFFLKEISSGCSLEDWCWSWNSNTLATWCEELTHWERPWCGERLRAGEGLTEDEMVGWHHQFNRHGFGWTPGVGDGLGGLACCSSWVHKESDMTEWLNWTELIPEWPSGFPYILQFKSKFCIKELMI